MVSLRSVSSPPVRLYYLLHLAVAAARCAVEQRWPTVLGYSCLRMTVKRFFWRLLDTKGIQTLTLILPRAARTTMAAVVFVSTMMITATCCCASCAVLNTTFIVWVFVRYRPVIGFAVRHQHGIESHGMVPFGKNSYVCAWVYGFYTRRRSCPDRIVLCHINTSMCTHTHTQPHNIHNATQYNTVHTDTPTMVASSPYPLV